MFAKHHFIGYALAVLSLNAMATVNCQQTFPDVTKITPDILIEWSSFAAKSAYQFDFENQALQFDLLKSCFTNNGWKSFEEALEQSNNLQVIKSEKLSVSAIVKNDVKVNPVQPNIWKVQVPMTVEYDNATRHMKQEIVAELLIETQATTNGQQQLGITQFVAKPNVNAELNS